MSSSGIRESDSTDKRTKKLTLDREEDLINSFKTWDEATSLSSLAGGGTQSSGEGSAPGNFMKISGDNWLGQYGNQFEITTIQNGQLNVSRQSGTSSPILVVNPESGSPDFLDTMVPGTDILFYQEQLIHTVNQTITIRPKLFISLTNIVGIGGNIVEVTVSDTSLLTDDDKVDISNTTNFDIFNAIITVTSGTTFTYDLGSTASTTPESSGNVDRGNLQTQDGANLVCPINTIVHFIFNTVTRLFQIDAITIATGGGNGGNGGISFPIDFPEDDRGTVGASTQDILFSASTRHSVKMVITGDIDLSFSSPPSNETAYSNIIITQDNIGGHILTLPAGTVNKDTVEAGFLLGANEETGILIKFAFGVFYAFLETGNIVSGGPDVDQWSTFPAIQTVDIDTNGISNTGAITGATKIDFIQSGQLIDSVVAGLDYFVAPLQRHEFKTSNGSFMAMNELNPSERRIDVKQNRVTNIGKLTFTPTFEFDIAGTAEIYEVLFVNSIRYVSRNAHTFVQEGVATLLTIGNFMGEGGFVQDIGLLNFNSINGEFLFSNGDFQLDGINMKVLTNNKIINLSDIATLTTKGDLFGFDTKNARIPVGSDGQVLTANSAVSLGVEWVAGGSGANTALSNLDLTTAINSSLVSDTAGEDSLGSPAIPWANLHTQRVQFQEGFGITNPSYGIARVTGNILEENVPSGASYNWMVDGLSQMQLDAVELFMNSVNINMDGNDILDVADIGNSIDIVDNIFADKIRFPSNNSVTVNAHMLGRVDVFGTDTTIVNVPVNEDFMITENGATVIPLFHIDTSSDILTIGANASLTGMNFNDKSIGFLTGLPMEFNSTSGFSFIDGDTSFDNRSITSVNRINLTTQAGAAVGSIIANSIIPNNIEMRLGAASDFLITDDGSPVASFDNVLSRWRFDDVSIIQLPQDTQISDRGSAPSTPPSGFVSLYVINIAGAQSFRIKFDNGTEKIIADDV